MFLGNFSIKKVSAYKGRHLNVIATVYAKINRQISPQKMPEA